MKELLVFVTFFSLVVAINGPLARHTESKGGYVQKRSGTASFTTYTDCNPGACGQAAFGFTAAISQLAFGSDDGPGDSCGRCFKVTGNHDPFSPDDPITPRSIIVMVTDECPLLGNELWCGQTQHNHTNTFGADVHFDMCADSGASAAFFQSGTDALTGSYEEVSCLEWKGTVSNTTYWDGACLAPLNTPLWPSKACGNHGTAPQ